MAIEVFEVRDGFGLEHLVAGERPLPEVGPGRVRLRMRAACLNYRDLMMVQGSYNPKQPLPIIPCSDGVGEVVAVGEGVSRVAVGDRVSPIFAQGWLAGRPRVEIRRTTLGGPLDGTLAEQMVVGEEGLVAVPEHLSDEEAACLPCAAVTAWSALVEGGVKAGDTVLTLGTGGVSIFTLQLARALGARVIVTSSSDEKLERALSLGAWRGVNYREEPQWGRKVRELTGGDGADFVLEVGGAGTLEQSLSAVRLGGVVALIGVLAGAATELNIAPIFMKRVRVRGIFVGHREAFEDLNRALAVHQLRPVVDRVFPFAESRGAFEHMAAGAHFGKIVIRIAQ